MSEVRGYLNVKFKHGRSRSELLRDALSSPSGTIRDCMRVRAASRCDAIRFGNVHENYTARRHLAAAYFATDAFANARRQIVREARSYARAPSAFRHHLCVSAHSSRETPVLATLVHNVDRNNYRTFPTSTQPCALTF